LEADDYKFLSELFSAYATDFEEGEPVMHGPTFQDFLESFIGAHKYAAIEAGMLSHAEYTKETGGEASDSDASPEVPKPSLRSEKLALVMKDIEAAMQPGALKDIVSSRHFACCGNVTLLAKALKSVATGSAALFDASRGDCICSRGWIP
jgi:hypothetical protein